MQQAVQCPGNVLIFGANGSGKSRLGAWIELRSGGSEFVHRISAQRALTIPDYIPVKTLAESLNEIMWGNSDPQYANFQYKSSHRWGSKPDTFLLNDYEKVLSALFASDSKRNKEYVETARAALTHQTAAVPQPLPIPPSELDTLQEVWRDIMPHRRIVLADGQVKAYNASGADYKGGDMSDGEKVALYLLAQCLMVKTGSTIIVDEPELHLHRSLMARLWSSIERLRPDCLFVFITHDLDFAATRVEAKKVWVRSYSGGNFWDWGFSESIPDIPDAVLLEVLGSRKPILFVEGDRGSLDTAVLQAVYSDFHVIARGGCDAVIQATKAFQLSYDGIQQSVFGVVDRDFRAQAQVTALNKHSICVLPVAEIENLICAEPVLRVIIEQLAKPVDETIQVVKSSVLSWLKAEFDTQVALRTRAEIKFRLSMLETSTRSGAELTTELSEFVNSIDVQTIWSDCAGELQSILDRASYEDCLHYYNRKTLPERIAPVIGLQKNGYTELVLNLLNSPNRDKVLAAFRRVCPEITRT